MTDNDDNQTNPPTEDYSELISRLESLHRTIDVEKYPGQAWPVDKGRGVVFKLVSAVAITAAAALLVWACLRNPAQPVPQNHPAEQASSRQPAGKIPKISINMPQYKMPGLSQIRFKTPTTHEKLKQATIRSMPKLTVSFGKATSVTMPQMSFPMWKERNS